MNPDNFPSLNIYGQPDPLLVALGVDKRPHFVPSAGFANTLNR
jgi:hypothetical protein